MWRTFIMAAAVCVWAGAAASLAVGKSKLASDDMSGSKVVSPDGLNLKITVQSDWQPTTKPGKSAGEETVTYALPAHKAHGGESQSSFEIHVAPVTPDDNRPGVSVAASRAAVVAAAAVKTQIVSEPKHDSFAHTEADSYTITWTDDANTRGRNKHDVKHFVVVRADRVYDISYDTGTAPAPADVNAIAKALATVEWVDPIEAPPPAADPKAQRPLKNGPPVVSIPVDATHVKLPCDGCSVIIPSTWRIIKHSPTGYWCGLPANPHERTTTFSITISPEKGAHLTLEQSIAQKKKELQTHEAPRGGLHLATDQAITLDGRSCWELVYDQHSMPVAASGPDQQTNTLESISYIDDKTLMELSFKGKPEDFIAHKDELAAVLKSFKWTDSAKP